VRGEPTTARHAVWEASRWWTIVDNRQQKIVVWIDTRPAKSTFDIQKEDRPRDHYRIVDVRRRRVVDEVTSLLEQPVQKTKREVLAAARLG